MTFLLVENLHITPPTTINQYNKLSFIPNIQDTLLYDVILVKLNLNRAKPHNLIVLPITIESKPVVITLTII